MFHVHFVKYNENDSYNRKSRSDIGKIICSFDKTFEIG